MKWGWTVAAFVTLIAGVVIWTAKTVAGNRDRTALAEQFRLARAAGLPPTAAEYMATIPKASPVENAAPLYRKLHGLSIKGADPAQANYDLIFRPSAATRAAAKKLLTDEDAFMRVVDEAVTKPKCWWNRDWTLGYAVLLPEYADMKSAARFLALRGSLAADRGDSKAALEDIQRILKIAAHAREEPIAIADLVSQSIHGIARQALADWVVTNRDRPVYMDALAAAIKSYPRPDLKREQTGELFSMLELVDDSTSSEGLRRLGVRSTDIPVAARILPMFMSQPRARVKLVDGERRYYSAFDLPGEQRDPIQKNAKEEVAQSVLAFPLAASLYGDFLAPDKSASDREHLNEAWRLEWTSVLRALRGGPSSREVVASDLKSPYDGKAVTYHFDSKQIVVTISGTPTDTSPELKVPPDKALHPVKKL